MQYYLISGQSSSINELLLHIKDIEYLYISTTNNEYPFRVLADILLVEYNNNRPKTIILAGKLGFGVLELTSIIKGYIRIIILESTVLTIRKPKSKRTLDRLNHLLLEYQLTELTTEGILKINALELSLLC